jgi:hypothetical protein
MSGFSYDRPERPNMLFFYIYIGLTILRAGVTTCTALGNLEDFGHFAALLIGLGLLVAAGLAMNRKRLGLRIAMIYWAIDLAAGVISLCSLGDRLGRLASPLICLPFALDLVLLYFSYHYLYEEPGKSYFE